MLSILSAEVAKQPRSPKRDEHIFWMASQRFHALLADGRLILAAVMLDEIREAGETLLSGPESDHALGRRMVQMAADPFRGHGFLSWPHVRSAQ
jgi:hypothetical protein